MIAFSRGVNGRARVLPPSLRRLWNPLPKPNIMASRWGQTRIDRVLHVEDDREGRDQSIGEGERRRESGSGMLGQKGWKRGGGGEGDYVFDFASRIGTTLVFLFVF